MPEWPTHIDPWTTPISNRDAKLEIAQEVAQRAESGQVVGCGSGSTSYLAVLELGRRHREEGLNITAIASSIEIELVCRQVGLPVVGLNQARPDWAFDGADEVDPRGDAIKGRGAALLREKLTIDSAASTVLVVDKTKLVEHLGESFAIPVEVIPLGIALVENALLDLGASTVELRVGTGKDGPVITEHGNVLFDARFDDVPPNLEDEIARITGVVESGLFQGRSFEILTPA